MANGILRRSLPVLVLLGLTTPARASIFGEENIALMKLVAGQIVELERLASIVDAGETQIQFLSELNRGIQQTVDQIQAFQAIADRAQGLDPTAVRSLSELNNLLDRAKAVQSTLDEMLSLKLQLADQAISQTALQSDTAYKMGQEMVSVGTGLAAESRSASPGRAAQITAASSSAQMLSQGVALQTLAQMAQLQALSVDLQKSQMERDLIARKNQQQAFQHYLGASMRKSRR